MVDLLVRIRRTLICLAVLCALTPVSAFAQKAQNSNGFRNIPEERISRRFDSIRNNPLLLNAFLREMPKGGDLHNHLSGAVYAESYIQWAAEDGLCVDRKQLAFAPAPCTESNPAASAALHDPVLFRDLVDAFSMRGYRPNLESGHDHFFDSFAKFGLATRNRGGDMLAEVVSRAADQHQIYLELLGTPSNAGALAKKITWNGDMPALREQLLNSGMADVVAYVRKSTDESEARMRELLHCGTPGAQPGCYVQVRYINQGIRGASRETVFSQLVASFELAQADPRFVGVNLVSPEDSYVSVHDFELHMRMLQFLHQQYPKVHISLHAGELAPGLVAPEDLRNHIRDSVEIAHAERIGHGADIMYEREPMQLLKEMAQKQVLVEICLTSNDGILNLRGSQHPFPLYWKNNVPVTLGTDDQGVARSNITAEYQRAVESYGLHYPDLKRMVRLSLEHSFLSGASLWSDFGHGKITPSCRADRPNAKTLSAACSRYLHTNERADMQWKLEQQFAAFELN